MEQFNTHSSEICQSFMDDYDQASFLSTGIPAMDAQLIGHGIRKQRLGIILGRPDCGKTFFIVNWMLRLAEMGQRSYFFSGEMSLSDCLFRFLQVSNRMHWKELLKHIHGRKEEWISDKIQRYLKNIEIDTTHPLTINHIEQQIKLYSSFVDWFFIDHHKKIRMPSMKDRFAEVDNMMHSLIELKDHYDTRIMLIVMANRGPGDGSTAPALHEAWGSSGIDDGCDLAYSLGMPGRDKGCAEERQNSIELVSKKNRYGFKEHFAMFYNPNTGVLYDTRNELLDVQSQEEMQNLFNS